MVGAIEVPLFPYALFQASLVGTSISNDPICSHCPSARTRQKGRNFMKIKIRYENEYQTLEVENMELEKWLNISISEDESQEDYEQRIQDVIEERFNRPDYNSWHKHDRHTGNAKMKNKEGVIEVNTEEAIMAKAKTELTLTFADIEAITGCTLCKSAYNYSAYWNPSPTHTMPNTILAAGFKVVSVDLVSKSLLLQK